MSIPKCVYCGANLRRYRYRAEAFTEKRRQADGLDYQWGDYGDGFFCGLRCGHAHAVKMERLCDKLTR